MTSQVVLSVKSVDKSFNTPQGVISILEGVNFEVHKGEKVAIVGPSGSGKSTLLSLIGLLDNPTSGEVSIDGVATGSLSSDELAMFRNQRIGFIFQNFELIAPFTVYENISAPLDIAGKKADESTLNSLIDSVGLSERKSALPFTLSGGEKQRVAIARALANQPNLILADEPTGSLDRETGEKVLRVLLDTVATYGKTLVIITHDPAVADKMDRVLEIKNKTVHERA
jgi:putative ABC transport system ATP-binding protein